MAEVWRAPQEREIVARIEATEKQISEFFTQNPDSGITSFWEGIASSKHPFLSAAKVTMAAQNIDELDFFIQRELKKYRINGWVNNNAVFTNPEDYEIEDVRTFLNSKPTAAETATIPIDKRETVTVGKFLLGNLNNVRDPEKSFPQVQREATRDLAMLRFVLGGPGTHARSNLMGRYLVFSYVSGLAMRATDPTARPETIAMPVLPPPKRGAIDDLLAAIDAAAPPVAKVK